MTVASSAPVRHALPAGISVASSRPLSEGRPYSTDTLAPSTVHAVFTWGLPPLPMPVCVVVCAAAVMAKIATAVAPVIIENALRIVLPECVRSVTLAGFLHRCRQRRNHLEHVADDTVVGHLEDRGFLVLVDRNDRLRRPHTREMLDCSADP